MNVLIDGICLWILNLGWLRFMLYVLHSVSKCNLNTELLSYIKYWHLGYLLN
jgi:hypothetical protein